MMTLHRMQGTGRPLSLGGFAVHGIVFADNGYGEFVAVDSAQYIGFMQSGFAWH